MKTIVTSPKPRNRFAVLARLRHAGRHFQGNRSMRRKAARELQDEMKQIPDGP